MADHRILRLIKRLRELTEAKRLSWNQSERDGMFLASFSGHSVGILVRNSRRSAGNFEYVLRILDQWGETIEEVGDEDFDDGSIYSDMKSIFEKARTTALGVDDALDSILLELDQLGERDDDL